MKQYTPERKRRQILVKAFLTDLGTSFAELAREYGCSPSHMRAVLLEFRNSQPIVNWIKQKQKKEGVKVW